MRRSIQVFSVLENEQPPTTSSGQSQELRRRRWPAMPKTSQKLRIVDLYCGCGGLTLGALQAAVELSKTLEVALAVDMSKPAMDVYRSNFTAMAKTILLDDITNYISGNSFAKLNRHGISLVQSLGKVDVLLAGPPCQGNSDLNNSSRRSDPRNDLYLVPALFADELTPDLVVIENVPSVVHGQSNVVNRSISKLKKNGYSCHEFRADLTALGLPQTRKRHLLIASRIHSEKELAALIATIPTETKNISLKDFIADLEDSPEMSTSLFSSAARPSATNLERINYLFEQNVFDLPDSLRPPCHRDKKHSYISMYGRLRNDTPAQTITSGFGSMGQGRFVHPTRRRTITPHEAARIQGFPDYFSFGKPTSVTELRQMIGNAVAPILSFAIITKLLG